MHRLVRFACGSAAVLLVAAAGCAPSHVLTTAEVPAAAKLDDVMWAQAQLADPAFRKISAAAYTDADYGSFVAVSERLAATSAKLKASFSKGPAFDAFADALGSHAQELGAAVGAKDSKATSTALAEIKNTCRSCHHQFK